MTKASVYQPQEIEKKWRSKFAGLPAYAANDFDKKRKKKYVLVEFPYPSGSGLHVGHSFSFTGSDVYARYLRMKGENVLFPMGWDSFGLPTENYAIKMGIKPQKATAENTAAFKEQMKKLGISFDWARELDTTDPTYYKWTQWIFIKLFEKGLAEKKEMPINWCPKDKIGLANEEVIDGKCERCGTEVIQRNVSQWVVKITDYAERLLSGLDKTDFIVKVKASQINWIGKKEGINVNYPVVGTNENVTCFTTAPVNFGMTFIVLAPEHEIVRKILDGRIKVGSEYKTGVAKYVMETEKKSEMDRLMEGGEKSGVFTGLMAKNVVAGWDVPIWIADFVLSHVGTGAVQGCPGHDYKDFEFAKKFGLPIKRVVVGPDGKTGSIESVEDIIVKGMKGRMVNSRFLDGLEFGEGLEKTKDFIEENGWGKRVVSYHLRDWIFSRQHYWGEPIPMIFCDQDGWVTVPEEQLPVHLPEVEKYQPTDTGESPLANITEFVETTCPKCGQKARRETDTMPNWAGSDWYFLRYIDPKNDGVLADMKKMKYWLPVDVYVGGDEHNTLHLLYSRFIYQFLWDLGVVPKECPEPYIKRLSHGLILGPDGHRMSKTRGNVISPEVVVEKYGADTLRAYLMFLGPFDATMAWNERTLMGVKRFLERFYRLIASKLERSSQTTKPNLIVNSLVNSVGRDLENFKFNTAIAKLMESVNGLSREEICLDKEDLGKLVKMLAPIAPFLAEELWSLLGNKFSVHGERWPDYDPKLVGSGEVTIVVQVNGKTRGTIQIESNKAEVESEIKQLVEMDERYNKWLQGLKYEVVFVKGRLINFVIK